jgi:hypothetical protein
VNLTYSCISMESDWLRLFVIRSKIWFLNHNYLKWKSKCSTEQRSRKDNRKVSSNLILKISFKIMDHLISKFTLKNWTLDVSQANLYKDILIVPVPNHNILLSWSVPYIFITDAQSDNALKYLSCLFFNLWII